jgi:hypothetical protein
MAGTHRKNDSHERPPCHVAASRAKPGIPLRPKESSVKASRHPTGQQPQPAGRAHPNQAAGFLRRENRRLRPDPPWELSAPAYRPQAGSADLTSWRSASSGPRRAVGASQTATRERPAAGGQERTQCSRSRWPVRRGYARASVTPGDPGTIDPSRRPEASQPSSLVGSHLRSMTTSLLVAAGKCRRPSSSVRSTSP